MKGVKVVKGEEEGKREEKEKTKKLLGRVVK